MNDNDDSWSQGHDPDTAPDLSKGRWPQKFANAPVHRGTRSHQRRSGRDTSLLARVTGTRRGREGRARDAGAK